MVIKSVKIYILLAIYYEPRATETLFLFPFH